jgi:hypothetical protein
VKCIKFEKLQWTGYIMRSGNDRITKNVLDGKFNETNPVGRPRLRCEDIRSEFSLLLNIEVCRRLARGRDIRRGAVEGVRARCGL